MNKLARAGLDTFRNQIIHTDLATLCASLPPASVDMILCDLPYGTTSCSWDSVIPFADMWRGFKRVIKPRGAIVLTGSQPFSSHLIMSNVECFRYEMIWHKRTVSRFLDAKWRPLLDHENVLVFGEQVPHYYPQMRWGKAHSRGSNPNRKRGAEVYRDFERTKTSHTNWYYPRTVFQVAGDRARYINICNEPTRLDLHPTQKPIALFEYLIKTYTRPGAVVLDPCAGSGTTAVAARKLERDFVCGDIEQKYVDLAWARLARSDPFSSTRLTDQHLQLSLFASVNG